VVSVRSAGNPGTGLGLAIVEIVDLHQGRIEVESGVKQHDLHRVAALSQRKPQ
jgi:signal transduction histidine kinase